MIDKHGEQVREFYRKQGEVRERERIIKLLETETEKLFEHGAGVGSYITVHIIALIKVDNK